MYEQHVIVEKIMDQVLVKVKLELHFQKQQIIDTINEVKYTVAILENQVKIMASDAQVFDEKLNAIESLVEAIKAARDYLSVLDNKLNILQKEFFGTKLEANKLSLSTLSRLQEQKEIIKSMQKQASETDVIIKSLLERIRVLEETTITKKSLRKAMNNKNVQRIVFILGLNGTKIILGILAGLGFSQVDFVQDIVDNIIKILGG